MEVQQAGPSLATFEVVGCAERMDRMLSCPPTSSCLCLPTLKSRSILMQWLLCPEMVFAHVSFEEEVRGMETGWNFTSSP